MPLSAANIVGARRTSKQDGLALFVPCSVNFHTWVSISFFIFTLPHFLSFFSLGREEEWLFSRLSGPEKLNCERKRADSKFEQEYIGTIALIQVLNEK